MEEIKKSKQNKIINILLSFVIFILLILFGLKINFTKVVVNGSSMHPTLIGNYKEDNLMEITLNYLTPELSIRKR